MSGASAAVQFREGRLYLSCAAYEEFFGGIGTVILIRQEHDLLVLPVRNAASGGYLIKIRNAAGDRVVNGADFFRHHGLSDKMEWNGEYGWSEERGGLQLYAIFPM